MKTINLILKESSPPSYDISIGDDVLKGVCNRMSELDLGNKYFLITDSNVTPLYGAPLLLELRKAGLDTAVIEFPAGEESKNIDTALFIVRQLLKQSADRKSVLIALGGGVVGDMTGFVASLYMRSVPYVQIPTTLVAQVDSSIGGKTAIDLQEGKNLLGAFYQPRAVFIDPVFLETLPAEEFGNGLAEMVKYGIIDRSGFFSLLETEMANIRNRCRDILTTVIERSCLIKKGLVEIDEKDQGPRHFLNFGHTIGHALEAASGYGLSHGKGVALGMMASGRLSEKVCGLPQDQRQRMDELIEKAGLPTVIPCGVNTDLIMSKLKADKKKSGSTINFVLIRKIGEPFLTGDVTERIVRKTIEELKK